MHLCCDIGSTHCGSRKLAKEAIAVAKDNGADSVKFQLFKGSEYKPNIELNRDLFIELVSYGKEKEIPVTASAFDVQAVDLLVKLNVPFIKIAYSKSRDLNLINGLLNTGRKVVVTTDALSLKDYRDDMLLTRLYVDLANGTPQYPVPWMTSFEGIFPLFDGYSDHHKGIGQAIEAVQMGATWLEKHFSLQYDECKRVPDFDVSISPRELYELAKAVK